MITKKLTFMLLMGAALVLAGCRSKTEVIDTPVDPSALTAADAVTRVNMNRLSNTGIRSKLSLRVESGGKHISVGGKIQMVRDDVIHISITPYGLIEVGVLELTPDYLLFVDRWHKQYFRAKWKDIKSLNQAGVDFLAFQALFWEELYVPGYKGMPKTSDFNAENLGESVRLKPQTKSDLQFEYIARTLNGLIEQTAITTQKQSDLVLEWNYSDWKSLGKKSFPGKMLVGINTSSHKYSATFTFSHISADDNMKDVRTKLDTERYRAVDFDYIMGLIMSM